MLLTTKIQKINKSVTLFMKNSIFIFHFSSLVVQYSFFIAIFAKAINSKILTYEEIFIYSRTGIDCR